MLDLFDDLAQAPAGGTLASKPLPSGDSAGRLVEGDTSALPVFLLHWGVRTGLVAAGLYAVGARDHLLRNAFAASTAIEAFVVGWAFAHRKEPEA